MASKGRTKKFPEIKKSRQGAFTEWAENNGFRDACSAASAVMKNTKKYSDKVVKMAKLLVRMGNALIAFGNKVKCGWNWLISRLMFTLPLCTDSKCKCKK